MSNSIEKQIELKAPLSRVWRALTDYREFGEWFRVKLDGPSSQVSCHEGTSPILATSIFGGKPRSFA
jgi:uncharacterized protein YndB with AHSA1/START domain